MAAVWYMKQYKSGAEKEVKLIEIKIITLDIADVSSIRDEERFWRIPVEIQTEVIRLRTSDAFTLAVLPLIISSKQLWDGCNIILSTTDRFVNICLQISKVNDK